MGKDREQTKQETDSRIPKALRGDPLEIARDPQRRYEALQAIAVIEGSRLIASKVPMEDVEKQLKKIRDIREGRKKIAQKIRIAQEQFVADNQNGTSIESDIP
ncbi:hypothetical protein HY405_00875 [Candidatus Microgenomates bacterium]|nr:hypothetical protein [Candidatus Microgenomates bacterium]